MATKEAPGNEWGPDQSDLDANRFDSFARRAAASLRSPAPDDGLGTVIRQGNRQRSRHLAIEVAVVVALVVAGVAVFTRSDTDPRNIDNPPQPTTETTVPPVPSSIPTAEELNQWFLDYTGNPPGPATGDPVKFGVVMTVFSYQYQLDSAMKYLNKQAGGVGGRPIELDVCIEALPICADRFAADPSVLAVLENEWAGDKNRSRFGESVGNALAGRKPLHTTYFDTGTSGVGYYPTYYETVWSMVLQARKLTAPGAQVIVVAATDQDSLRPDSPQLTSGLAGRDVVLVRASESKSLADTIRDAGATDAAAIVLAAPPFDVAQIHAGNGGLVCDDFTDAINELGMHAAVIVDTCDPHEGWYKVDVGVNESAPGPAQGALQITTAMPHLGTTTAGPATRDIREAGALLAVIRVINELGGPAKATPAALDQAMREFTGPVPLGSGPLDCAATGKLADRRQPGSCVRFVDVHQFVHDAWIDLAPIDLGA